MEPGSYTRLADALRARSGDLQAGWIAAYAASPMRLPGAISTEELHSRGNHLWSSLVEVFTAPRVEGAGPPPLRPGSPELREVEQAAAFLGGNLASTQGSGFDVAALILSLRDVLLPLVEGVSRVQLAALVEWLAIVGTDSFGMGRVAAVDEKYREQLEEGTPLIQIVPELPAVLLVGEAETTVIDSVLSRLLLTVVRVGARAVVLDVAGVADPTTATLLERLNRFLTHRKVEGRCELLVVGLGGEHQNAWSRLSGAVRFFEYFDGAVAEGLRISGYRLVRTPTTGH